MENKTKWVFYIAGVQHHDVYKVEDRLEEGSFLNMVLEPSNEYDKNAIRLEFFDVMIGYVPGKISAEVNAAILSPKLYTCKVISLDWDERSWKQIKVEIKEAN